MFDITCTVIDPPEARAIHEGCDTDNDTPAGEPGWVTSIVRVTPGDPDVVENVTVADRATLDVFAHANTCTDASPVPDAVIDATHDALDDTDHDTSDDTCTVIDPPATVGCHDDFDTDNDGGTVEDDGAVVIDETPGWVTTTVRVTPGDPDVVENVTVADRATLDVFAHASTCTDPSPVPDAVIDATHDALDDTDHDVSDDTCTVIDPPATVGCHDDFDTDNDGPAAADDAAVEDAAVEDDCTVGDDETVVMDETPGWVTTTVRVTPGDPDVVENVTVADRATLDVFAHASTCTDASPVPDAVIDATHDALDDTDHDVSDDTCTVIDPPATVGCQDDFDTDNDGVPDSDDGAVDDEGCDVVADVVPVDNETVGVDDEVVVDDDGMVVQYDAVVDDDDGVVVDDDGIVVQYVAAVVDDDGVAVAADDTPACVTCTITITGGDTETVENVTIADRATADVFGNTDNDNVRFPELDHTDGAAHATLDTAVHDVSDDTDICCGPPSADTDTNHGDTDNREAAVVDEGVVDVDEGAVDAGAVVADEGVADEDAIGVDEDVGDDGRVIVDEGALVGDEGALVGDDGAVVIDDGVGDDDGIVVQYVVEVDDDGVVDDDGIVVQ
ncbi:MAG: hypothetical protein FWF25_04440 [Propionibacteriaceae bacterium]|nr:hypothetical protein [Propionibacteriaceae bacterium]